MQVSRSVFIAAAILLAIVAYFGVRSLARGSLTVTPEDSQTASRAEVSEAIIEIAAQTNHMRSITARGRTAPDKAVTVRSGTAGVVVAAPVREGTFVRQGTLLCGLEVEARSARVREAEALRDSARIDFEAAATLAAQGLTPANREAAARAQLDAAEAAVNSARVELARTQIRAPFDGVFERRLAEAGDYLSPGAACGLLVDLDPVIVAADVTDAEAGLLAPGMEASARLADGREFPATLRFVSQAASEQTRTFLIEAALETGEARVAAGVTASLSIPTGPVRATRVPRSLLTLSDSGQLGVRHLVDDDRVAFQAVTVIDEGPDGIWVTGLPETARLIAMGQDYLADGVPVRPVMQGGARP
jgi:multidrug efflux system membrane fusion protein